MEVVPLDLSENWFFFFYGWSFFGESCSVLIILLYQILFFVGVHDTQSYVFLSYAAVSSEVLVLEHIQILIEVFKSKVIYLSMLHRVNLSLLSSVINFLAYIFPFFVNLILFIFHIALNCFDVCLNFYRLFLFLFLHMHFHILSFFVVCFLLFHNVFLFQ